MGDDRAPRSWDVGDVKVTRILEHVSEPLAPSELLRSEATVERLRARPWLQPAFVDADGRLRLHYQSHLLELPGLRVLVDTGIGGAASGKRTGTPEYDELDSPLLGELTRAGVAVDAIDVVVMTHLHVDHVGWNTIPADAGWRPTFPRARYVVSASELAFAQADTDPGQRQAFADSIAPLRDAGVLSVVAEDHVLHDTLRLVHTPGHTPGHVSVRISSRGEEGMVAGDMVLHPCQLAYPSWSCLWDVDPGQAARVRTQQLEALHSRGALLFATHFPGAGAGRLARDGDGFTLV